MVRYILFFAGFGAIFVGMYFYPGDEHLKPEWRDKHDSLMLWHSERYTAQGQQLHRRAYRIQLMGIFVLLGLTLIF